MGNKTKATAEVQLLGDWDIRRNLGNALGERFAKPIEACDESIAELEKKLAAKQRERIFLDRKARAAIDQMKSLILSGVDEIQIYDEDLRRCLSKSRVETTRSAYNSKTYKHERKPTGAAPWAELVKKGATDAQIRTNMENQYTPSQTSGDPYLGREGLYCRGRGVGEKPDVEGAELVKAIRRVLKIPEPAAGKAAPTKAAATKPAQTKPAKPDASKTKPAKATTKKGLSKKSAAKTKEIDEALGSQGKGGAVAPPAPPAASAAKAKAGFGPWARAAKKALRRRKFDASVVTDAEPWFSWHGQGMKASAAADKWIEGADTGAETARVGGRATPPLLVVDGQIDKRLEVNTEYEPFDVGLSPGDVAAAAVDLPPSVGGVIVNTIIRFNGTEEYAVVERKRGSYQLRRLVATVQPLDLTGADPFVGRSVNVGGTPRWLHDESDSILVEDAPASRAEGSADAKWNFTSTFPPIVLDPNDPNEFDALGRMGITHDEPGFHGVDSEGDPVPGIHEEVMGELIGLDDDNNKAREVLANGVYVDAGPKKNGKPMAEKDRRALEAMIAKNQDLIRGSLNWYQDLFGEEARAALVTHINLTPLPDHPDETPTPPPAAAPANAGTPTPNLADRIKHGVYLKTSYGTGPFRVLHVEGDQVTMVHAGVPVPKGGQHREIDLNYLNGVHLVGDRIFTGNRAHGATENDEVFIVPLAEGIAAEADDADDDTERTKPGEIYEPHELTLTPEEIVAAFAGKAITRGDPAKVPGPLIVDGHAYLYVGLVDGEPGQVARLVKLIPELEGNAEQIKKLRDEPEGAYCGRRVEDPVGDTYVVAPESYNLLVRMPGPLKED